MKGERETAQVRWRKRKSGGCRGGYEMMPFYRSIVFSGA